MTPVGHSLFGATIAVAIAPASCTAWRKAALIVAFVVLANVPDAHLPAWGHDRYDISHSLIVNGGLIILAAALLARGPLSRACGVTPRLLLGGAAAWLSHLLLDSFYNHGLGLAIFWPLGNGRLALPLPWFTTVRRALPHIDAHTARILGIECLAYGSLLATVCFARRALADPRRESPGEAIGQE